MKVSRRSLLALGIGATQMNLLERFGLGGAARASPPAGYPTKLLSIYVPGGLSHEQLWCPFSDAAIPKFVNPPAGGAEPYFYNAQMVANYDGSSGDGNMGSYKKIRGPIWWNPQQPSMNDLTTLNPASNGAQKYVPWGYSWVSQDLGNAPIYSRTAMIHGINQGTAAHASGVIASMCGVAGADFRAPGIAAVVANALLKRFPDRPLPSVSIGGLNPKALSTSSNPISGAASAIYLTDLAGLTHTISDYPDSAWAGLRARHPIADVDFSGTPSGGTLPATVVDEAVLNAIRGLRGKSTVKTDALLEQLFEAYGTVSKSIARDVVKVLTHTVGAEHVPDPVPWGAGSGRFGYRIGYADGGSDNYWDAQFDLALRLLKSDMATSITMKVTGSNNFSYDSHDPPAYPSHVNNLRGTFEVLGRLFIEMSLTPSPSQPGKSLLDETVVHIFSDFGRTFMPADSGTDHHPATTVLVLGGNIQGNRMFGGYDETFPHGSSPLGVPVNILSPDGSMTSRVPMASDGAATVLRAFGLQPDTDFFIPGGYGEVAGVLG